MAAVTICSDFGAPKNKVSHCLHCFPLYLPWNDGTGCHDTGKDWRQDEKVVGWHHQVNGHEFEQAPRVRDGQGGLACCSQKTKIMASGPTTSWEIDGETVQTVADFIFLGSKITTDGDCSHEIKRHLLLGKMKPNSKHRICFKQFILVLDSMRPNGRRH